MDGVPGFNGFKGIAPNGDFVYRFSHEQQQVSCLLGKSQVVHINHLALGLYYARDTNTW
jgi:hypothetical protein